tara:strand:- start:217 stop:1377 length:1161 start_codon:yes stop_codon:yes gene_type:complete
MSKPNNKNPIQRDPIFKKFKKLSDMNANLMEELDIDHINKFANFLKGCKNNDIDGTLTMIRKLRKQINNTNFVDPYTFDVNNNSITVLNSKQYATCYVILVPRAHWGTYRDDVYNQNFLGNGTPENPGLMYKIGVNYNTHKLCFTAYDTIVGKNNILLHPGVDQYTPILFEGFGVNMEQTNNMYTTAERDEGFKTIILHTTDGGSYSLDTATGTHNFKLTLHKNIINFNLPGYQINNNHMGNHSTDIWMTDSSTQRFNVVTTENTIKILRPEASGGGSYNTFTYQGDPTVANFGRYVGNNDEVNETDEHVYSTNGWWLEITAYDSETGEYTIGDESNYTGTLTSGHVDNGGTLYTGEGDSSGKKERIKGLKNPYNKKKKNKNKNKK